MGYVTTEDDVQIFYKDWGPKDAQPIVFHHGWPLSSDDWDAQMLFFLSKGYRVVAHDRRGHGRSTQTATGNDMDTYAADVAELQLLPRPEPHEQDQEADDRRQHGIRQIVGRRDAEVEPRSTSRPVPTSSPRPTSRLTARAVSRCSAPQASVVSERQAVPPCLTSRSEK
mgnify:CR=1 FL=1